MKKFSITYSAIGIVTHVFSEFADRNFLIFSFLNREILPLPRGVLDMFKEGK